MADDILNISRYLTAFYVKIVPVQQVKVEVKGKEKAVNCLQYLATGSTLTAVWPFQLPAHSLELSPAFHPRPDHQCRLL